MPQKMKEQPKGSRWNVAVNSRWNWLSLIRTLLRILILLGSTAIFAVLLHSLSILNADSDPLNNNNSHPQWPAGISFVPTGLLIGISLISFIAGMGVLILSFKQKFGQDFAWQDAIRVGFSAFMVTAWIAGLVVFKVLEKIGAGSVSYAACASKSIHHDFLLVCNEQVSPLLSFDNPTRLITLQNSSFYIVIGVLVLELVTLITLGVEGFLMAKKGTRSGDLEQNGWR
jgi:hypothetical protein